jgi:hypothetical protein
MPLLTWVGDDTRREATFQGCTFTLTKTKRGCRLRVKGKDVGVDASGSENMMLIMAGELAAALAVETGTK